MKNMKKIISSVLLFVLLFNFIFLNKVYSASEDQSGDSLLSQEVSPSDDLVDNILEDGSAREKQGNSILKTLSFSSFGTSIVGFILGILARLFNAIIALEVDVIMGQLTFTTENGQLQYYVTIDRLVFNRIPLLNSNSYISIIFACIVNGNIPLAKLEFIVSFVDKLLHKSFTLNSS